MKGRIGFKYGGFSYDPQPPSVVGQGLVMYNSFDNVDDSFLYNDAGSDFNIQVSGGGLSVGFPPTLERPREKAVEFYASPGDYTTIKQNNALIDPQLSFSFSVWVKPYLINDPSITKCIFSCSKSHGTNTSSLLRLRRRNGQIGLRFEVSPSIIIKEISSFNTDAWNHIGVTYNSSNGDLKGWMNGSKTLDDNIGTSFTDRGNYGNVTAIGNNYQDAPNATQNWYGWIDEAAMWQRELSEDEMYSLWNNGDGMFFYPDQV